MNFDCAIVGGGIVGLATALALSKEQGLSLIVLEAEERLAAHQTGRNSGVIHSGLYYQPGSLKARNCVEGRKALVAYCQERGVPVDVCGKIVVATKEEELERLEKLESRGRANGLLGLERLDAEQLRQYEPHVAGIAGLWVPETGIVDFGQVAEAYADEVREHGGEIRTKARVYSARPTKDGAGGLLLKTAQGDIGCRVLVACCGLQADRVAWSCGVDPGVRIVPFRGEYYELAPERQSLVRNLIYPVPDPELPFLGVHFTRMIAGGVEAGPNAVLAFKREGYGKLSFSLRDTLSCFTYPGFWKMARVRWRTALAEQYRSWNKRAFVTALQRLMPDLRMEDVVRGGAGVRAQALDPDGRLADDFRISESEQTVQVLNAPSPAATASLSIGRTIADLALKKL